MSKSEADKNNVTTDKVVCAADFSDIFTEFGDPGAIPPWMRRKPSTFAQGARCQLDERCKKVNTQMCDILKCQKSTTIKADRLNEIV